MAITLSGSVSSITKCINQNSAAFGTTYSGNPIRDYEATFTSSQITKISFANYSVSTGTTIDLTNITDPFGNAISFATVKHLQIVNNDLTNSLTVGGGSNPVFAALPSIIAGGCVNLTTNLTVGGSTKNLLLTAGAGTISVDVYIIGS